MRTFEEFPKEAICPICGRNNPGRCFLVPIDGTSDGKIAEACVVHIDCIDLRYSDKIQILYQKAEQTDFVD